MKMEIRKMILLGVFLSILIIQLIIMKQ